MPLAAFSRAKIDYEYVERTCPFSTHQGRVQEILSPAAICHWRVQVFKDEEKDVCGKGDGSTFARRDDAHDSTYCRRLTERRVGENAVGFHGEKEIRTGE